MLGLKVRELCRSVGNDSQDSLNVDLLVEELGPPGACSMELEWELDVAFSNRASSDSSFIVTGREEPGGRDPDENSTGSTPQVPLLVFVDMFFTAKAQSVCNQCLFRFLASLLLLRRCWSDPELLEITVVKREREVDVTVCFAA